MLKSMVASSTVLILLWVGPSVGTPDPSSPGLSDGAETAAPIAAPAPAPVPPTTEAVAATTTTTAPTTTTTPPLRRATVAFTGDVLVHSRVWQTAAAYGAERGVDYDFAPMFAPVETWIQSADWAVCHMEVNLAADNQGLSSFPIFRAPGTAAGDMARLGYDSCTTASNHTLDRGTKATFETLDVLDAAGLQHTGSARSPEEAESTIWLDVNGIRIAHLSYAYGFNGFQIPTDTPWATNLINEERILTDAANARAAGADLVMLSLHWGEQYQHSPNSQQADLGPRLLASPDVDLIVGHHAHVVQRIDRIDGEWLVYGLGNVVSNQTQAPRRDELMVTATISEQADGSFVVDEVEVLPMMVDTATLTIWPSGPSVRPLEVGESLAAQLDASWARVVAVLEQGTGFADLELIGN